MSEFTGGGFFFLKTQKSPLEANLIENRGPNSGANIGGQIICCSLNCALRPKKFEANQMSEFTGGGFFFGKRKIRP